MTLHVDPWLCIRRVGGTPQRNDESGFEEPWDNLRGAAFHGELDGVWTITGSLEEYQGIPTAWERHWMGEGRSLPGWGRMKPTQVDVWTWHEGEVEPPVDLRSPTTETRSLCLWRTTPRNGETTLRPWHWTAGAHLIPMARWVGKRATA